MYIIASGDRYLLYDCLWQDSYPVIRRGLKELGISYEQICGLVVSHFHPDHGGCSEILRRHGVKMLVTAEQFSAISWLNDYFLQPKNDPTRQYLPLNTAELVPYSCAAATEFLHSQGIAAKVLPTPGHSEDSISLIVATTAMVGDLPPQETAAAFGGSVASSWQSLLDHGVKDYYHAHTGYNRLILC